VAGDDFAMMREVLDAASPGLEQETRSPIGRMAGPAADRRRQGSLAVCTTLQEAGIEDVPSRHSKGPDRNAGREHSICRRPRIDLPLTRHCCSISSACATRRIASRSAHRRSAPRSSPIRSTMFPARPGAQEGAADAFGSAKAVRGAALADWSGAGHIEGDGAGAARSFPPEGIGRVAIRSGCRERPREGIHLPPAIVGLHVAVRLAIVQDLLPGFGALRFAGVKRRAPPNIGAMSSKRLEAASSSALFACSSAARAVRARRSPDRWWLPPGGRAIAMSAP